jgi:hypothetical protein
MSCGATIGIKPGDSIPLNGRFVVKEWDEDNNEYVDRTDTVDFSTWSIEAEVRNAAGTLVGDFNPQILAGGVYLGEISSATTAAWPPNVRYFYDVRFRDETGGVRSTSTGRIEVAAAQSGTPT